MEKLKSFKGDKTWQELLLDYALYIILDHYDHRCNCG